MSKTTDVIVVGSGLAGLMAALTAASKNCKVRVISQGMGCLAIGAGVIDVLGYDNEGKALSNPFDGFKTLPENHPYSLLGEENVKQALADLTAHLSAQGLNYHANQGDDGEPRNFQYPTIMGTLKPTYLFDAEIDPKVLDKAENILVVTINGFRDCKPQLIISQLRRYKAFNNRRFTPLVLPEPFKERGRSLNALDLAKLSDREHGREWMLNALKEKGKGYDLALIPPMLGLYGDSGIKKAMAGALGCPYIELISVPPAVGGLRLRKALVNRLNELNVEFFENAEVESAEIKDNNCVSLTVVGTNKKIIHHAKAFVIATGGIISGGVLLEPGKAREVIFGIDIPVPANVEDWSDANIFGKHLVTSLGVAVDKDLRPLDGNNAPLLQNVFFAGRSLGGYDYAAEKSGNGVAASTGWKAGNMAASLALSDTNQAAGA